MTRTEKEILAIGVVASLVSFVLGVFNLVSFSCWLVSFVVVLVILLVLALKGE